MRIIQDSVLNSLRAEVRRIAPVKKYTTELKALQQKVSSGDFIMQHTIEHLLTRRVNAGLKAQQSSNIRESHPPRPQKYLLCQQSLQITKISEIPRLLVNPNLMELFKKMRSTCKPLRALEHS